MLDSLRGHGRLRTALAASLAALTIAAPAAARTPVETVMQDDAAFLHRTDEGVREAMSRAKALGVDRLRITAGWSVIAPDPDSAQRPDFDARNPDAYPRPNWRNLDRAVRTAHELGLEVMIDVAFWAPLWATSGDPNQGRARWNLDPQAYADFSIAVARRYSGTFVPESDDPSEPPPPSQDRNLIEDLFAGGSGGQSQSAGPGGLPILGEDEPDDGDEPDAGEEPDEGEEPDDGEEPDEGDGDGDLPGEDDGEGDDGDEPGAGAPAADGALPRVRWWTIWNEPNHQGFVQPQWVRRDGRWAPRSPHIYRRMVEAAYPAIKGVQPDSLVLVGGTSSTGTRTPRNETTGMAPLLFLRELACVDSRLRPVSTGDCADYRPLQGDGFSHHPYSLLHLPNRHDPNRDNLPIGDLDRLTRTLDRLVAMRRIDPDLRDVYLTEYGYETNPPDPIKPFNLEQQARLINWAEYLGWRNRRVRSWPQFLLDDLGAANHRRPYGDWQSGLYFVDGTAKPSATSFRLALFAECAPLSRAARRASRKRRRARRAQLRTVMIWGHVRPGSGPRDVSVEASVRGSEWATAATAARRARRGGIRASTSLPFTTDAGGVFVRYAVHRPGTTYRLESRGADGQVEHGLPVTPVRCGRAR